MSGQGLSPGGPPSQFDNGWSNEEALPQRFSDLSYEMLLFYCQAQVQNSLSIPAKSPKEGFEAGMG